MSVFYKLYQEKRKGSAYNDKWYARAVNIGTIDTDGLVEEIEKICTVTDADVLAVLRALVFVMKKKLQESYRVKINEFGSFKVAISTKPADSAKEFSARKNVVGTRVLFQPDVHYQDGKRVRQFLQNLTISELPANAVVKEDGDEDEGNNG